jgi:hypothetical protein
MLVSPPGVAANYRRGESLSRGFSILEAEAPMPRGQRGSLKMSLLFAREAKRKQPSRAGWILNRNLSG